MIDTIEGIRRPWERPRWGRILPVAPGSSVRNPGADLGFLDEVNMRALSPALSVLFCWLSFPAFAQQGASPAQVPTRGERPPAARRITLDVVVTDRSGNAVPGLQQQDFTLLDDKQPQKITSFYPGGGKYNPADIPLKVILIVDAINTPFQGVAVQRGQLKEFLRHDGGELPLPTSLAYLADKYTGQTPVTQDGNVLVGALSSQQYGLRTTNRSQGFYGGIERANLSIGALEGLVSSEATQPGRKLLIWLGPGWPLLSGPGVKLTAKDQDALFREVVRLSAALRDARITLYNINRPGMSNSLSREFYYENFLKGVGSADKVQNGNLGLQVLAVQSGGRVLNASNDVADSIARCLEDRKAFYTLTFDSPAPDHPDEYHRLQVKIGKPGLTARTRTGYYAQP
jgi:VWFA-related protein